VQRSTVAEAGAGDLIPSNLSIDYLCDANVFRTILGDSLDLVYPLLLIHRPSFRALVDAHAYANDPAFYRLWPRFLANSKSIAWASTPM
jgi:hypothetical protein